MASSRKKKSSYDKFRSWRHIDVINFAFVIFMSSFFLLYVHDYYFDITATRAFTFYYGALALTVLSALSCIVEWSMLDYYGAGTLFKLKEDEKAFLIPDVWSILFLLSNVISFLLTEDKKAAFTGENGRRFGLLMIISVTAAFLILARGTYVNKVNLYVLSAVSAFCNIFSVLQNLGLDPFGFLKNVAERQKEMFVSTFGNINTFGSFICISAPIFIAVFIFSDDRISRVISGILIYFSAMGIVACKSDNVYLGLGTAILITLFLAQRRERIGEFLSSLFILSAGIFTMSILNNSLNGSTKHLNGVAEIAFNWKYSLIISLIALALVLAAKAAHRLCPGIFEAAKSKKGLIITAFVVLVCISAVLIWGFITHNEMLTFSDKWGSYRGYIWKISLREYMSGSAKEILFGRGNESTAAALSRYRSEMVKVTGKTYDNCHNELLQYLLTTGFFGMISYLGLFITSIIYMFKRHKWSVPVLAMLTASVSYFAQGCVNLNQSITSPIYFVLIAVGIGYIRYRDGGYGVFKEK